MFYITEYLNSVVRLDAHQFKGEKPKHAVKAFHFLTSTEPMSRPL